jgi:hypothetical protein
MNLMTRAGLIVLLADHEQQHAAIEVADINATSIELAELVKATSDRLGFQMEVHAVLPVRDHPHAVEQARKLLRFTPIDMDLEVAA